MFKKENHVYNIKNGEIKKADKAYNNTKHDYEIIFNSSTIIERSGVTDIPSYPQLKTIENVFSMDVNTLIGNNSDIWTIQCIRYLPDNNYKLRYYLLNFN